MSTNKKKRASKYEKKVGINTDFENALRILGTPKQKHMDSITIKNLDEHIIDLNGKNSIRFKSIKVFGDKASYIFDTIIKNINGNVEIKKMHTSISPNTLNASELPIANEPYFMINKGDMVAIKLEAPQNVKDINIVVYYHIE